MVKEEPRLSDNKPAKKHHFIPQMLLAMFTADRSKSSTLWAFDQKTGKQFPISPKNIAFENDLYTIEGLQESAEIKQDYLEQQVFSVVEGKTAPIIESIDNNERLPEKDSQEYFTLMEFISLLFLRTPQLKASMNDQFDKLMKFYLTMDLAHAQQFETYRTQIEESLKQLDPSLDFVGYESYVEKVTSEDYHFQWSQNHFLQLLLDTWKQCIPYFYERIWDVYIANISAHDNFISSDNPVRLDWSNPSFNLGFYGIGLSMKKTQVSLPLSKKMAIIGTYENEGKVINASRYQVACINSLTGMNARRFLFSPYKNFYWLKNDQQVYRSEELIRLKRQRLIAKD